ncbi:MAG: heavy-metal-associated domain-containing protein [Methylacidiphilales bacterium]|nr:heavy-metal-associated domain-containing protein [Candidatus Methylacidiphilales bacterium]NJR15374.1 heavy-metal-associated domain-containing protein [Calothrix sp. CSU_2_0]
MPIQLNVSNMACSACGETIVAAIKAIAPDAVVKFDVATKLVSIETEVSEVAIKDAIAYSRCASLIATAGYSVT